MVQATLAAEIAFAPHAPAIKVVDAVRELDADRAVRFNLCNFSWQLLKARGARSDRELALAHFDLHTPIRKHRDPIIARIQKLHTCVASLELEGFSSLELS